MTATTQLTQTEWLNNGQWMAEQLGISHRSQHFVSHDAREILSADGWPTGYVAVCGAVAIPANARYLTDFPICPRCAPHQN